MIEQLVDVMTQYKAEMEFKIKDFKLKKLWLFVHNNSLLHH